MKLKTELNKKNKEIHNMKINISKVDEENKRLSNIIENTINDPKNHHELMQFNNINNINNDGKDKDKQDFSSTFFNKNLCKDNNNNSNNNNFEEKDDKNMNITGSVFNGGNKTSTSLPSINIGNLIKLKEVMKI